VGTPVDTRTPQEKLKHFEKHLAAFVPDYLAVEPHPKRLLKAIRRIPEHLDKKKRYNTTIFAPDERKVFQDTSYPWSALGRCETNFGPFSGVLIGPRHLLTCNHGIDRTPPPPGLPPTGLRSPLRISTARIRRAEERPGDQARGTSGDKR
jgi:hypothetical protein